MTTQPLKTITLSSNFPPLGPLLSNEAPAGVTVEFDPIIERRSLSIQIANVVVGDIHISLDLLVITSAAFARWLIGAIRKRRTAPIVKLNGEPLSDDEAAAVRQILRVIESQKGQNDSTNR